MRTVPGVIKDVARGVFRRCLPVLLALALTAANGSSIARRPATGRPAVISGPQLRGSVEQSSDSVVGDNTVAAVVVTGREQVLSAQNTVPVGASRAPPVLAA